MPTTQPARSLTFASYNVHRCIGTDGTYSPERIRDVLRSIDADVVALQEVEVFREDPGILDYLCEDRLWSAIHGITLHRESGQYGNALLTRLPIGEVTRQDLTVRRREPRGAIHVRFPLDDVDVNVTATHLGLRSAERSSQAQSLSDAIKAQFNPAETAGINVLMGDFNQWFPWSRSLGYLRRQFKPVPALPTFPSRRPFMALDRIWASGTFRQMHIHTLRNPLTRRASDHLPIVANIEL